MKVKSTKNIYPSDTLPCPECTLLSLIFPDLYASFYTVNVAFLKYFFHFLTLLPMILSSFPLSSFFLSFFCQNLPNGLPQILGTKKGRSWLPSLLQLYSFLTCTDVLSGFKKYLQTTRFISATQTSSNNSRLLNLTFYSIRTNLQFNENISIKYILIFCHTYHFYTSINDNIIHKTNQTKTVE